MNIFYLQNIFFEIHKLSGLISHSFPMEFLSDVSSTSAADIKGDDITVEVLFRTSRRRLAQLLERRSYLYPWGAAHAQNGLASARTVSSARHLHQWGATQPMAVIYLAKKVIGQGEL